ncbi:hypothetical protein [Streptomyces sp. NPDC046161]|uniref:hypothetical protein n=1 Tax=Streptomyces sp. NPDC046161 TaxID=3155132 RepID=UPI0033F62358
MEEVVFRLEELLFPPIADVAVLSVAVNDEAVSIEARSTVAGAICPGARELGTANSQLLPAISR